MVEVAIDPNQAAIDTFYELKMDKKHRYCIFTIQIEGKEEIILHKAAPRESTFADLKADLDNHPRYVIYDFEKTTEDKRKLEKLCFILYSPDTAPIKEKMMLSSCKERIKKAMTGIQKDIQINEHDDLIEEEIMENLFKQETFT